MPLPADPLAAFHHLPDEARLWLLLLDQATDGTQIAPALDAALAGWRHKGTQYHGAWTLLEGRILAIAEPTLASQPSGCAIDGMLRSIQRVVEAAGLALGDPQDVVVRLHGSVQTFHRSELEARLQDGTLQSDTPLLDLALYALGDLRHGRLEKPLAASWVGRKYKRQAPAGTGA